jgi:hypothetical protein
LWVVTDLVFCWFYVPIIRPCWFSRPPLPGGGVDPGGGAGPVRNTVLPGPFKTPCDRSLGYHYVLPCSPGLLDCGGGVLCGLVVFLLLTLLV